MSPAIVNARPAPDRRRREQDHPLLAPPERRPREALVAQLRDVDIVISGGGDDLLANPATCCCPRDAGRPVPHGGQGPDARDVPIVTTQGEYRYVGRLTVTFDPRHITATDTAKSGPVRVTADPAQPDSVAEDATLKTTDHRPARRLQGGPRGERDRHHRGAARRRQPEPDPPRSPTSATSSPTASWPRSTAPRPRTAARGRRRVLQRRRHPQLDPRGRHHGEEHVRRAAVRQRARHGAGRHPASASRS